MDHIDLVVVAAGVAVTVASIVMGAWLDLRPRKSDRDDHGKTRDAG